ncbi:MAG TPA: NDP-sugar synthase [Bdellovibrionales bacterium]|nr:NDP-sugar synthase [Bdellovibrionales bacterium]
MKAMLLTAGLGTRLRPVTDHFAKPAVPFLGTPLVLYPAFLLKEVGVDDVTLNTHWKAEQVEALTSRLNAFGMKTHISPEPVAPLGSGGGIWKARPFLEGSDFWVCNGDEVILPRKSGVLTRVKDEHRKSGALATIAVMRHPLVGSQFGGVWCDSKANVLGFGKDRSKFPNASEGFHYIGVLLLSSRVFDYLPEGESNILYDALVAGINRGETVRAVVDEYTWFETGNPKDFLHATSEALELLRNAMNEKSYDEDAKSMDAILRTFNPSEFKFGRTANDGMLMQHRDSKVADGVKLGGFVVLEKNSRIESGAVVEDSVLMPGAVVKSGERRKNEIVLPV